MRTNRVVAITGLGLMLAVASVAAHHAFSAEFDVEKPITLVGTVTKAEWVNPHVWLYVDVKSSDGQVVNWAVELGPPNALVRRGWKRSSMPFGTELKVEGFAAKNGKPFANASDITLPNGTKFSVGSETTPQRPQGAQAPGAQ
jgi:hypothetical protein